MVTDTKTPPAEPPARRNGGEPGTKREIFVLGTYLALLSLALLVAVYWLWPTPDQLGLANAGDHQAAEQAAESPSGNPPSTADSEDGAAASPPGTTAPPEEDGAASLSGDDASPPPGNLTDSTSTGSAEEEEPDLVPLLAQPLPPDRRILLLVIVVGMLGSVIGAGTSFAGYVGNKTFEGSWVWWYILRPLLGCMLALLLYFTAQAGFLKTPSEAVAEAAKASAPVALEKLFYAAVAIAGLAGMFSKLTSDKLESIFAALLQSDADKSRKNKMKNDGS